MTTKPGLLTISLMGLLLCGPACFDGGKDSNDTGGETEGDADADADGDTDTDGQSPWIEAGDAYCYQHKTGEKFYQWEVNCIGDDPQGADTLESFHADAKVDVLNSSGGELASYALVCNDSGECFGSFRETDDGIACSNATSYTIRFQVVDEDGNTSAPYELQGRQQ